MKQYALLLFVILLSISSGMAQTRPSVFLDVTADCANWFSSESFEAPHRLGNSGAERCKSIIR